MAKTTNSKMTKAEMGLRLAEIRSTIRDIWVVNVHEFNETDAMIVTWMDDALGAAYRATNPLNSHEEFRAHITLAQVFTDRTRAYKNAKFEEKRKEMEAQARAAMPAHVADGI